MLQQISYVNFSDNPPTDVVIAYTLDDGNARAPGSGGAGVGTGAITVGIAAVNDRPVNTVPLATQSVNEDANLVFSAGNGNQISIADADVAGDTLTVTLGIAAGVLTLGRSRRA